MYIHMHCNTRIGYGTGGLIMALQHADRLWHGGINYGMP